MPDWKAVVVSHLKGIELDASAQQEVVTELADHLEDRYEHFLAQGMIEADAHRLTLDEIPDWPKLGGVIARSKHKEEAMNQRSKILWLPGLVAFSTASILLMILQRLTALRPALLLTLERIVGFRPTFWWRNQVDPIYFCWWVLLPLCGAAGAYLSRRAGGTRFACLASSLFPSIVMLGIFCFVLPVSLVIDKNAVVRHHPFYFVLAMVIWTVVPGLALILGALPFLPQSSQTQQQ